MAAIYLEEFARQGRMVDIIEVNINNLAAVPSIVFGLLGLAVYINLEFRQWDSATPERSGYELARPTLSRLLLVRQSGVPTHWSEKSSREMTRQTYTGIVPRKTTLASQFRKKTISTIPLPTSSSPNAMSTLLLLGGSSITGLVGRSVAFRVVRLLPRVAVVHPGLFL